MFCEDALLGCPSGLEELLSTNSKLNSKVLEHLNESQELMMLNTFAYESNEYNLKKCLQDRISEIRSWRWVLEDLSKRLEDTTEALEYELSALRVVVQRVRQELESHSRDATRPGALSPLTDAVEETVLEEYKYLREQKKVFEKMIDEVNKQIKSLKKTKKMIEDDIQAKEKTINIEENWIKMDANGGSGDRKFVKKKRKTTALNRWEKRCSSLKNAGLKALRKGLVTRLQVRAARVQLSIQAQALACKVDTALRRRLHANQVKLDELRWQREEVQRDLQILDGELRSTEESLLGSMEQARALGRRLAGRTLRPTGELTRDDVGRALGDELAKTKQGAKGLRDNREKIEKLKRKLEQTILRIDCLAEDLAFVINLDLERISFRQGEDGSAAQPNSSGDAEVRPGTRAQMHTDSLPSILEEDEIDDYPFDD